MFSGYKILVAEDNALNQKIANFLLNKQGAEIVTVNNGQEAIHKLEQQPFDLVLMDIQMPEMDGYETTAYIRNIMKSDIPVIALSASNFAEEHNMCLQTGMNACITKPFDINKLYAIIEGLIKENKITSRNTVL